MQGKLDKSSGENSWTEAYLANPLYQSSGVVRSAFRLARLATGAGLAHGCYAGSALGAQGKGAHASHGLVCQTGSDLQRCVSGRTLGSLASPAFWPIRLPPTDRKTASRAVQALCRCTLLYLTLDKVQL